jgi:hypothetical protein
MQFQALNATSITVFKINNGAVVRSQLGRHSSPQWLVHCFHEFVGGWIANMVAEIARKYTPFRDVVDGGGPHEPHALFQFFSHDVQHALHARLPIRGQGIQ